MSMSRSQCRGFTLIELIVFIVVVSVALAGILVVMNTSIKNSADPLVRKQTIAIAESLLEEILLKDYISGPGGGSRAQFDDVSDYANYGPPGGIVDVLGNAVPGLGAYSFSPSVSVTSDIIDSVTVLKVTVSVTGPGGTISLTGYRSNY
jgi:MSHA pilin protein MshD